MRIEEEEEKGENRGRVELRMCRTYKDRGGGLGRRRMNRKRRRMSRRTEEGRTEEED